MCSHFHIPADIFYLSKLIKLVIIHQDKGRQQQSITYYHQKVIHNTAYLMKHLYIKI